ncbi:MAG: hypothetical protein MJ252_13360 [archaeon]|nr:hypothetical protein [archaeon]
MLPSKTKNSGHSSKNSKYMEEETYDIYESDFDLYCLNYTAIGDNCYLKCSCQVNIYKIIGNKKVRVLSKKNSERKYNEHGQGCRISMKEKLLEQRGRTDIIDPDILEKLIQEKKNLYYGVGKKKGRKKEKSFLGHKSKRQNYEEEDLNEEEEEEINPSLKESKCMSYFNKRLAEMIIKFNLQPREEEENEEKSSNEKESQIKENSSPIEEEKKEIKKEETDKSNDAPTPGTKSISFEDKIAKITAKSGNIIGGNETQTVLPIQKEIPKEENIQPKQFLEKKIPNQIEEKPKEEIHPPKPIEKIANVINTASNFISNLPIGNTSLQLNEMQESYTKTSERISNILGFCSSNSVGYTPASFKKMDGHFNNVENTLTNIQNLISKKDS